MKRNYKRPEQLGFTFEQYTEEYNKRYPSGGPSQSSDCGGENFHVNCGCWVCRMIDWKEIIGERKDTGEERITEALKHFKQRANGYKELEERSISERE